MDRRTPARLLLALLVASTLTACAGDDQEASGPASPTAACATQAAIADAPGSVSTDLAVAPKVPTADDPPPCGLQIAEVVVGRGAEATPGSAVTVKYVGALYGTAKVFDSSWSRGKDETLPVTLGARGVIQGFDQGITGMQVGGRRIVVIPSDLGYGDAGQGEIPGGAALVFVIDLVSVS